MLNNHQNDESLRNYPAIQMTLAKETTIQCAFFKKVKMFFRVVLFNTFFRKNSLAK